MNAKDTHPRKEFASIVQAGLRALNLETVHHAALSPRLPAGTAEGLEADLQRLGGDVPGAQAKRAAVKAATATQDEALAQGYALVTAVRLAVQRSGAGNEVRRAYGVGSKTSPRVVKNVKAAITQIVDRAIAFPEEASALGILPKDVAALQDDLAAITQADDTQEQQKAGAPQTTKDRNRTANRILAAVDRIAGAGVVEFAKVPVERAAFEALLGLGVKGSGKKAGVPKEGKKANEGIKKEGAVKASKARQEKPGKDEEERLNGVLV